MFFASKLSASREKRNVFLFNTIHPVIGLEIYVFLKVKNNKLDIFRKFKKGDKADLLEYGEIIKFGFEENPPQEVIDEINNKYKTNF